MKHEPMMMFLTTIDTDMQLVEKDPGKFGLVCLGGNLHSTNEKRRKIEEHALYSLNH